MKEWIWVILLVGSCLLLLLAAIKSKTIRGWIGWVLANMAISALIFYILNTVGIVDGWQVPINTVTMITASLLGLPGIFTLIAISAWVI